MIALQNAGNAWKWVIGIQDVEMTENVGLLALKLIQLRSKTHRIMTTQNIINMMLVVIHHISKTHLKIYYINEDETHQSIEITLQSIFTITTANETNILLQETAARP